MDKTKFVILDGAMGTMLQSAGLPIGYAPERWNIEKPEIITSVAKAYIDAGADVVYANTFQANRLKIKDIDVKEVIKAGVRCAKKATMGTSVKVALDVGPLGQLLEPLGTLTFDEAYDVFKDVVVAGEQAGADLVVFETMSDLYEVKAAVLATKENTNLPIWETMTFEKNARTFVGVSVESMALTLEGLGVDAIGFNCSLGPKDMLPLVKTLAQWTNLPIILKPNAGLPSPNGEYSISPSQFAKEIAKAVEYGVSIYGGCCGTTPEYIKQVKKALENVEMSKLPKKTHYGVCSATKAVEFDGVKVVGERINPTGKKRFQQAIKDMDIPYILERGIEQQDAGAHILDVNVGVPCIDEPYVMTKVVKALQGVVDLPLQIDSSSAKSIEQGLKYYNGKPIVNSVNGDDETLDVILPLCKKYGAAVIGLAMDKNGIPKNCEERIAIAKRIVERAQFYGIDKNDVIIDCLTLTVSAQQEQAVETLKAVKHVRENMGLHATLGVSNISFGMPNREQVTISFLKQALDAGLDLPIVNPNQVEIMRTIAEYKAQNNQEIENIDYIARFASQGESVVDTSNLTVDSAIAKGLKQETARLVEIALESISEIDVVNRLLIPALDVVGEKYEKGEIFLPQLINSANAACEGFEVIKTRLAKKGAEGISLGKIVVATVKGDIHDIGKNIVKVVLENYGYTVIDLGRDVDKREIVDAIIKHDVKLVGLSALMTTTVASMADTIKEIRESGHNCKVWVGGAVLTEEYAKQIGADFYARDAKQSVDVAKQILG